MSWSPDVRLHRHPAKGAQVKQQRARLQRLQSPLAAETARSGRSSAPAGRCCWLSDSPGRQSHGSSPFARHSTRAVALFAALPLLAECSGMASSCAGSLAAETGPLPTGTPPVRWSPIGAARSKSAEPGAALAAGPNVRPKLSLVLGRDQTQSSRTKSSSAPT